MNYGKTPPRPPLDTLLRWFQAVIAHPDGVESGAEAEAGKSELSGAAHIREIITSTDALGAEDRLRVYANAYYSRLIECLGEVFPQLKKLLGDEAFDGFAFSFLQEHPSRRYTLHVLGEHFPAYLEASRSAAESEDGVAPVADGPDWPELLIDLARLEWAIYDAFDGLGTERMQTVTLDALMDVPPEKWDSARLELAPCLRILTARFPINSFFTALRQAPADDLPTPPDPAPAWIAISRINYIVRRYDLTHSAYLLLAALLDGESLGAAVDAASGAWTGDDESLGAALKQWFHDWAEWGFFTGISLDAPA